MPVATSRPSYELARRQRAALLRAIHDFEAAIAAPCGDPAWQARARGRLINLRDQLSEHIVVTEGPHGLYAALLADAPRLNRPVAGLVAEHGALAAQIESLTRSLRGPATPVTQVRAEACGLLAGLSRHRQRGADLVYEAYATDIGGET